MIKDFWSLDKEDLIKKLSTSSEGLSSKEAAKRLEEDGPNIVEERRDDSPIKIFFKQLNSPIMFILLAATSISFFTNDITDGVIILAIIFISAFISFLQEYRAGIDIKKLLKIVSLNEKIFRDGESKSISVKEVVSGDLVSLNTGDLIPADCRILEENDLLVDESMLTGETFPVEKEDTRLDKDTELSQRNNCLWMGTHVISGSAKAIIVNTAKDSEFGKITKSLSKKDSPTNFEQGVQSFGMLILRLTVIMIGAIFIFNIILKKDIYQSFMFALALAVGLTPQMLPAIISVNLSSGAKKMAKKQVIVKKLPSIENFGSMNILCSDKTGTITKGEVDLVKSLDAKGEESKLLDTLAYLNAKLQTGYENPLDLGIIKKLEKEVDINGFEKTGEVPYSFSTKMLTIKCLTPSDSYFKGEEIEIKKGAFENILDICSHALIDGKPTPIKNYKDKIYKNFEAYSKDGYRVLGLSVKTRDREIFYGYLLFLDPLKDGIKDTIKKLESLGVGLKIITGDNRLIAKHIAEELDLDSENILIGKDIDSLHARQIAIKARKVSIFAEIEPSQKEKIIYALRKDGNVVGYMGDGINDSPAIHEADVGISVNTAADTAKDAASIVLMENDLDVLVDGVVEGRKTFANTLKYIFIATSANFGNMFSMMGASLILKFLPLLPDQILLTNLMTDFPSLQLAGDYVEDSWMHKPLKWNINFIKRFIIVFGLISSIFDFLTFYVLIHFFKADELIFHTSWFMESILSATIAMLSIRSMNPIYKSHASKKLLGSVILVNIVVFFLTISPFGKLLGFVSLPFKLILCLWLIVILYLVTLEIGKKIFYKKNSLYS